ERDTGDGCADDHGEHRGGRAEVREERHDHRQQTRGHAEGRMHWEWDKADGSHRHYRVATEPVFGGDVGHTSDVRVALARLSQVRLDTLLAQRGLFDSRSRAAASVMAGRVRVGEQGEKASKPGQMVTEDIALTVDEGPSHVSRGGVKLANALERLGVPVEGRR